MPLGTRNDKRRTRWLVSQIPPVSFRFLPPPDPPEGAEPDGGVSGMTIVSSAPFSTTVIVSSCGRGTGERLGVSIVQFNAMVGIRSRL